MHAKNHKSCHWCDAAAWKASANRPVRGNGEAKQRGGRKGEAPQPPKEPQVQLPIMSQFALGTATYKEVAEACAARYGKHVVVAGKHPSVSTKQQQAEQQASAANQAANSNAEQSDAAKAAAAAAASPATPIPTAAATEHDANIFDSQQAVFTASKQPHVVGSSSVEGDCQRAVPTARTQHLSMQKLAKVQEAHDATASLLGTEHEATLIIKAQLLEAQKEAEAHVPSQQTVLFRTSRKLQQQEAKVKKQTAALRVAEEALGKAMAAYQEAEQRQAASVERLAQLQAEQQQAAGYMFMEEDLDKVPALLKEDEVGKSLFSQWSELHAKLTTHLDKLPVAAKRNLPSVFKTGMQACDAEDEDEDDDENGMDIPSGSDVDDEKGASMAVDPDGSVRLAQVVPPPLEPNAGNRERTRSPTPRQPRP